MDKGAWAGRAWSAGAWLRGVQAVLVLWLWGVAAPGLADSKPPSRSTAHDRRHVRTLTAAEVASLVTDTVAEAVAPCELHSIRAQSRLRVGKGELGVAVERVPNLKNGRLSVVVSVHSSLATARVPVSVQINCPPPEVQSGERVRIETRVGHVLATAPGRALQSGRVGTLIAVENTASGARLQGRVVGPQRVEVAP